MYKRECVRCFHVEACSHLDLEGAMFGVDAKRCPYYLCVTEPDEFKRQMEDLDKLGDVEVKHTLMDDRMCDLLKQFGYGDAVEIFKKSHKWYG